MAERLLPLPVVVLLVGLAAIAVIALARRRSLKAPDPAFISSPDQFHKRTVELEGVVVRVLENSLRECLKRWMLDRFRTLKGDPNPVGRYVHQRFLFTSPHLPKGERLLIEHNIKGGVFMLWPGRRLRVRGEYLHTQARPDGSRFGRIHKTHSGMGFIQSAARRNRES